MPRAIVDPRTAFALKLRAGLRHGRQLAQKPPREPNRRAKRAAEAALFHFSTNERLDQKSMPPMPPPPPPPIGIAGLSLGISATIASVVIKRPATEAASCRAVRTTLAGSMMPASIMSTYSSVWALKP